VRQHDALELRERSYAVVVKQNGVQLDVTLSNNHGFFGQIVNPLVHFGLSEFYDFDYAGLGVDPFILETLSDGSWLTASGLVEATPASSGFSGPFAGRLVIFPASRATDTGQAALAICASSSHRFTLVRR
jgi:hypothetical protein